MNSTVIGIRREDKSGWERRVALSPHLVEELVKREGFHLRVQSSENRTWSDKHYRAAGAEICDTLEGCGLVFAVKEIPAAEILDDSVHVFFSHTIKGQAYNMALLQRILDSRATLIDYELIADDAGRRLVFFGKHAGYAGMIDSLSALGGRLALEGRFGPLTKIRSAWRYADLEEARTEIAVLASELDPREGFAGRDRPLVVGITGYGNVSQGAQEILRLLPHQEHTASELRSLQSLDELDSGKLHLVVFKEEDMFCRVADGGFDLQEYFTQPTLYQSRFEDILPKLDLLVNAIYWTPDCPRLVTRNWVEEAWEKDQKGRLLVIGDISIDIEGSIECSLESTHPDNACYVYEATSGKILYGLDGFGPVIVAVDNLPCELPRDASLTFSQALAPYVARLARANWNSSFEELDLPAELKRAVIAHKGNLTPEFHHLQESIRQALGQADS